MASYVLTKAPEVMFWKVNDAILNGDGVGKPLGILNAGCTVTVSKESSQAADTVKAQNIAKMWSRMPANWRSIPCGWSTPTWSLSLCPWPIRRLMLPAQTRAARFPCTCLLAGSAMRPTHDSGQAGDRHAGSAGAGR